MRSIRQYYDPPNRTTKDRKEIEAILINASYDVICEGVMEGEKAIGMLIVSKLAESLGRKVTKRRI